MLQKNSNPVPNERPCPLCFYHFLESVRRPHLVTLPFFSIVTISYNQAVYLDEAINSVLSQSFLNYEYIVQDPGSTDGSRDIIKGYSSKLIPSFEPDEGPADGLNRAFQRARGRYYLFLNSDDILLPRALETLYKWISSKSSQYDVFSGACSVVNGSGVHQRYAYSDKMNLRMAAYGQCILIQPSSAISAKSFKAVGGFNKSNRSNWDGELFIDIALKGFRFTRSSAILSTYRIHPASITGSGFLSQEHKEYAKRMYEKITGNSHTSASYWMGKLFMYKRKLLNPLDTFERIANGPVFGTSI